MVDYVITTKNFDAISNITAKIILFIDSYYSSLASNHIIAFNGGPHVLNALISRISIKKFTRYVRVTTNNPTPIMADVLRSCISECRSFLRVEIDFASTLWMREHRLRKASKYKVYVSVFVCFVEKAIHLEVTSRTILLIYIIKMHILISFPLFHNYSHFIVYKGLKIFLNFYS